MAWCEEGVGRLVQRVENAGGMARRDDGIGRMAWWTEGGMMGAPSGIVVWCAVYQASGAAMKSRLPMAMPLWRRIA